MPSSRHASLRAAASSMTSIESDAVSFADTGMHLQRVKSRARNTTTSDQRPRADGPTTDVFTANSDGGRNRASRFGSPLPTENFSRRLQASTRHSPQVLAEAESPKFASRHDSPQVYDHYQLPVTPRSRQTDDRTVPKPLRDEPISQQPTYPRQSHRKPPRFDNTSNSLAISVPSQRVDYPQSFEPDSPLYIVPDRPTTMKGDTKGTHKAESIKRAAASRSSSPEIPTTPLRHPVELIRSVPPTPKRDRQSLPPSPSAPPLPPLQFTAESFGLPQGEAPRTPKTKHRSWVAPSDVGTPNAKKRQSVAGDTPTRERSRRASSQPPAPSREAIAFSGFSTAPKGVKPPPSTNLPSDVVHAATPIVPFVHIDVNQPHTANSTTIESKSRRVSRRAPPSRSSPDTRTAPPLTSSSRIRGIPHQPGLTSTPGSFPKSTTAQDSPNFDPNLRHPQADKRNPDDQPIREGKYTLPSRKSKGSSSRGDEHTKASASSARKQPGAHLEDVDMHQLRADLASSTPIEPSPKIPKLTHPFSSSRTPQLNDYRMTAVSRGSFNHVVSEDYTKTTTLSTTAGESSASLPTTPHRRKPQSDPSLSIDAGNGRQQSPGDWDLRRATPLTQGLETPYLVFESPKLRTRDQPLGPQRQWELPGLESSHQLDTLTPTSPEQLSPSFRRARQDSYTHPQSDADSPLLSESDSMNDHRRRHNDLLDGLGLGLEMSNDGKPMGLAGLGIAFATAAEDRGDERGATDQWYAGEEDQVDMRSDVDEQEEFRVSEEPIVIAASGSMESLYSDEEEAYSPLATQQAEEEEEDPNAEAPPAIQLEGEDGSEYSQSENEEREYESIGPTPSSTFFESTSAPTSGFFDSASTPSSTLSSGYFDSSKSSDESLAFGKPPPLPQWASGVKTKSTRRRDGDYVDHYSEYRTHGHTFPQGVHDWESGPNGGDEPDEQRHWFPPPPAGSPEIGGRLSSHLINHPAAPPQTIVVPPPRSSSHSRLPSSRSPVVGTDLSPAAAAPANLAAMSPLLESPGLPSPKASNGRSSRNPRSSHHDYLHLIPVLHIPATPRVDGELSHSNVMRGRRPSPAQREQFPTPPPGVPGIPHESPVNVHAAPVTPRLQSALRRRIADHSTQSLVNDAPPTTSAIPQDWSTPPPTTRLPPPSPYAAHMMPSQPEYLTSPRPAPQPPGPYQPKTWRSMLSDAVYNSLLERHGLYEMRRQEVIWELCGTEMAFVKSLKVILKLFVQPLRVPPPAPSSLAPNSKPMAPTWIPGLPPDTTRLFDWLDDIVHLHSQIASALHSARSTQYPIVAEIAECLRAFVPRFEIYQPYLVRLESAMEGIDEMIRDPESDFGEFLRIQSANPECGKMSLASFLLKPVQRLMKYPLFFRQLWELTPRNHDDHLATFSLLHSADLIIRVLQEVKSREEEYDLIKELATKIKGLPPQFRLARRERRLITHGLLSRVSLSDKERVFLDGNDEPATQETGSQPPSSNPGIFDSGSTHTQSYSGGPDMSKLHPITLPNFQLQSMIPPPPPIPQHDSRVARSRSSSVCGTLSDRVSAAPSEASMSGWSSSYSTASSVHTMATSETSWSMRPDSDAFSLYEDTRTGYNAFLPHMDSTPRVAARSRPLSFRGSARTKAKESPVYIFVFSDLVLLASPLSEKHGILKSPKSETATDSWKLLEDIGLSRVLGITDHSGKLALEHLIELELLPIPQDQLDHDRVAASGSIATPVYLSLSERQNPRMSLAPVSVLNEARGKWYAAFERCFMFTLRSLSFPTDFRSSATGEQDSSVASRLSVISLLASGLPLPKSPSQIMMDEQEPSSSEASTLWEREERGWWRLRFRQVLREMEKFQSPATFAFNSGLDKTLARKAKAIGGTDAKARRAMETKPLRLSTLSGTSRLTTGSMTGSVSGPKRLLSLSKRK